MFEFWSALGDVITIDMYVKNLHADLSDGIRSYDFFIDLDETKFDYVEGSFTPASGSFNDGAENQSYGEIFANGFFQGPWANYDDPLFSFQATDLVSSGSMLISFVDYTIYRTDFGNSRSLTSKTCKPSIFKANLSILGKFKRFTLGLRSPSRPSYALWVT